MTAENECILYMGTSLNNPPAGYYTVPGGCHSTGHICDPRRHTSCYGDGGIRKDNQQEGQG